MRCCEGAACGDHARANAAAFHPCRSETPPPRTTAKTMLSSDPSLKLARMGTNRGGLIRLRHDTGTRGPRCFWPPSRAEGLEKVELGVPTPSILGVSRCFHLIGVLRYLGS